jgi:hypothetical protein
MELSVEGDSFSPFSGSTNRLKRKKKCAIQHNTPIRDASVNIFWRERKCLFFSRVIPVVLIGYPPG